MRLALRGVKNRRPDASVATFPPCEIEVPALAACRLTMHKYESRVGPAIFPDNRDELPAVAESAILYEADLLMTILTIQVPFAPSNREAAEEHELMDSDVSQLA